MTPLKNLLAVLLAAALIALGAGLGGGTPPDRGEERCCCGASCHCAADGAAACACQGERRPGPALPPVEGPHVPAPGALREERAAAAPGPLAARRARPHGAGNGEPRLPADFRQGRRRHGVLSNWRE